MTEATTTERAKDYAQRFGELVKRHRRERGWTQAELAAQMEARGLPMHQTTVAKIERGARPTSLEDLVVLSDALGVPIRGLLPYLRPEGATEQEARELALEVADAGASFEEQACLYLMLRLNAKNFIRRPGAATLPPDLLRPIREFADDDLKARVEAARERVRYQTGGADGEQPEAPREP